MKVLVIAPHPDDEVLGCGGIIAKHLAQGNEVYVGIVTKVIEPIFTEEEDVVNKQHCLNAHRFLGVTDTVFLDLPAAMLESVPRYELNGSIGKLVRDIQPEEVYYYSRAIECKAKWDNTLPWNLTQRKRHQQKPGALVKQKAAKGQRKQMNRNIERAKQLGIEYVKQNTIKIKDIESNNSKK